MAELEAAAVVQSEQLRRANTDLEASRAALGESEDRLHAVLESATDYAIITLDLAGRITGWNAGAQRALGWTEAEVRWQDAGLIWTQEDREASVPEREMRAALETGSVAGERWHVRRDGTRFWAAGQLAPLRNGGLRGYLKILRDHTARRGAEERLRESEDRFRLIVEGARDYAIFTLDGQGRVTSWNAGAERILGWDEAEIVDRDAGVLFTPEDVAAGEPAVEMQAALAAGQVDGERWMLRRDGTRFWASQTLTRLTDGSGGGRGYLKILRDRTEQRLAEEAVSRSEAQLRTLSEAIPQLVWTSLADGHCDWVGPQWQAYTGLNEATSLGRGWFAAVHPDDRARLHSAWQEATAEGSRGGLHVEYRLRRNDGTWRWFQARAVPLPAEDRAEHRAGLRWFGTSTDIQDLVEAREVLARGSEALEALVAERTAELRQAVDALHEEAREREHAQGQLRQAQKMEAVGQLTGGIAHDFNNMLQGIGSSLEMLQRRIEQGRAAESGRYLETARTGVDRAAALTHRLLAFARRQALQPRPMDPAVLIRGMGDLIRRTVGPDIAVELHLNDGTWPVLCDPNQLESALLNLAINARDAMLDGGRLIIATEHVALAAADVADQDGAEPGDYVEVSVSDTGTGMAPDVLARAFEPFFTTKLLGQGTGLGLSQLYGFVRQSGGAVLLESVLGRGTTVRLCLPRHERGLEEALRVAAVEPERADAGETVLLVEDEVSVRALAAERLRELGYHVVEARDGPAALRALRPGARVDLLVTDVGLPGGLNGRQVAEVAREKRPGLPVLFITGYASGAVESALPPGMAVVGKPFALDVLAEQVRAMLDRQAR